MSDRCGERQADHPFSPLFGFYQLFGTDGVKPMWRDQALGVRAGFDDHCRAVAVYSYTRGASLSLQDARFETRP